MSLLNHSTKVRLGGIAIVIAVLGTVGFMSPSLSASAPSDWPSIELPAEAEAFDVGEQVSMNGVPMRMRSFTSRLDASRTIAWFKAKLGEPLVEDHIGNKTVLGRPQGDYYITIQIESSGTGVHGLIGVSDMRQALSQREKSREAMAAWARDLPMETRIVNLMSARDDGKDSLYLLATNQQSDALNAERATRALERRGFVVERELKLEKGESIGDMDVDVSGKTVLFKSTGREATVMAFHDRSGVAAIVINTTVAIR